MTNRNDDVDEADIYEVLPDLGIFYPAIRLTTKLVTVVSGQRSKVK